LAAIHARNSSGHFEAADATAGAAIFAAGAGGRTGVVVIAAATVAPIVAVTGDVLEDRASNGADPADRGTIAGIAAGILAHRGVHN